MARRVAQVIAMLLGLLLATITAATAQVRLEVDNDTITAIDEVDGAELWSFVRFSDDEAPIVGAREHEGQVLYAMSSTLYTVATRTGHVTKRKLYPAPIVAIHETDDRLQLELEVTMLRGEPKRVTIDYHPDAVYRAPWEVTTASPWQYEMGVGGLVHYHDVDFDGRKKVEYRLRRAWDDDLTNPFYPLALAILAKLNKEDEVSAELAERALALDAPWIVRLHLAELCEIYLDRELADQAWRQVDEAMAAARVPREFLSNHGATRLMQTSVFGMKYAVDAGDVELADRLVTRMRTQFPSPLLWARALHALAEWCEQHGRPDLAKKWHAAERDAFAHDGEYQRLQMIRRAEFGVYLLSLTLFVCALFFGLRRMRQRRWRLGTRLLRAVPVVALFVLLAGASLMERGVSTSPRRIDWVVLPAALGGYGSPQLTPFSRKHPELQAAADRDRALWGTDQVEALPSSDELFGQPPRAGHGYGKMFGRSISPRALVAWLVLRVFLVCVVLALLGRALRVVSPRAADLLLALTPGGTAGVFAPLLTFAFLLCLGTWYGLASVTAYPLDMITALGGWSDTKYAPGDTALRYYAPHGAALLLLLHLALTARAVRYWRRTPEQ